MRRCHILPKRTRLIVEYSLGSRGWRTLNVWEKYVFVCVLLLVLFYGYIYIYDGGPEGGKERDLDLNEEEDIKLDEIREDNWREVAE